MQHEIKQFHLNIKCKIFCVDFYKRFTGNISQKNATVTLSLREKINYLGFSPKFNGRIIASQGFKTRKDFCNTVSLSFLRYWDNIGLNIFLTVHIFEFF